MTYRHEITDHQGVILFWQKEYLSSLEKRTASMHDLTTKCGDQLFIWPNIEPEAGDSENFDIFYDQYAMTDTARMDNYRYIYFYAIIH